MAFDRSAVKTATSIPIVTIHVQHKGQDEMDQTIPVQINFQFDVWDQDDLHMKTYAGDLRDFITPTQIDAIQTFMNNLRTQAEGEVL